MRRLFTLLLILALSCPASAAETQQVEVFVTDWCPYCRKLESFLKKKKIPYARYDVERDAEGARLYTELGGVGVPFSRVNGRIVRGYDPDAVNAALKNGG